MCGIKDAPRGVGLHSLGTVEPFTELAQAAGGAGWPPGEWSKVPHSVQVRRPVHLQMTFPVRADDLLSQSPLSPPGLSPIPGSPLT